jgi:hypothetical protein
MAGLVQNIGDQLRYGGGIWSAEDGTSRPQLFPIMSPFQLTVIRGPDEELIKNIDIANVARGSILETHL